MTFPAATQISTNGIELEVFSAGSGKPLVLCHGWPEHAYSWRHQVQPLVDAGYHVIVPNQRGYGASTAPEAVTDYDLDSLTSDLAGLLDHYGYDDAVFIGHDWGAIVVWGMSVLQPQRVAGVINLSVPYLLRGDTDWISFWGDMLGDDHYIVHFNRHPGVADAALTKNAERFLRNMYRTKQWEAAPPTLPPGMPLLHIAELDEMPGEPIMSEEELAVFVDAFKRNTFTPGINWYRNFSRNWHRLADVPERVTQPSLMIYGDYDMVPKSEQLDSVVTDLEVVSLPCGHWIQQELPEETNAAILDWLGRRYPA